MFFVISFIVFFGAIYEVVVVAEEFFGRSIPVVALDADGFAALAAAPPITRELLLPLAGSAPN